MNYLYRLYAESRYLIVEYGWRFFFERALAFLLMPPKALRKYEFKNRSLGHEERTKLDGLKNGPLISIIVLGYESERGLLDQTLTSISRQWYANYEVILVSAMGTENLEKSSRLLPGRLAVIDTLSPQSELLTRLTGHYMAVIRAGDELTPDAFYEMALNVVEGELDLIYSDHDTVNESGLYVSPSFKSDFNRELLFSHNYIKNLVMYKVSFLLNIAASLFDLSNTYDLLLCAIERSENIKHVPRVLLHQHILNAGQPASDREALHRMVARRNLGETVESGIVPNTFRFKRRRNFSPLVSIIIPFKDKPELLRMCIGSILEKSTYQNFEIIGISNNSESQETFDLMKVLSGKDARLRFVTHDIPFNYSEINNFGATLANGDHLILLNNDIEIISPDWIESLLEYSVQEDVGAVGALLLYPNDTIQHAGVIIGLGGVAGHSHKHRKFDCDDTVVRPYVGQYLSAVTAACLMVKKDLFRLVDGLNEQLAVAFNDVDFCLRLVERGFKNVYTPYCMAYHHESVSRGSEDTPSKIKRFHTEIGYMKKRHHGVLRQGDPFYNPNLSLSHEDFRIRQQR